MIAPSGEQIEITAGDQQAVVVEVGGGLRSYSAGGRDLVDGYGADEMSSSGRGQVLIPWPNRLQDGSYEFDGRRHQLPLNEPERCNAIHGLVRWVAWTASAREPHRVVMQHVLHPQPGYPFSLRLGIEYSLSDSGLRVRTTATNIGTNRCPYGSGAHPYLTLGTPSVDRLILRVPGRTVLRSDERGLPMSHGSRGGHRVRFPEAEADRLDNARPRVHRRRAGRGWPCSCRTSGSGSRNTGLSLDRRELPLPDALQWGPASRRAPAQSCYRTDDVPAECISDRGRSDRAGARLIVHEYLGHRSRTHPLALTPRFRWGGPRGRPNTHSLPWTRLRGP